MKRILILGLTLTTTGFTYAQQAAQSISEFSFDLYKQVAQGKNQNVVFSPFSIAPAMGMVEIGARGETEQQIATVFHFDSNNPKLHAQMGQLQKNISALSDTSNQISITNRVWVEKSYKASCKYKRGLKKLYSAIIGATNFIESPEQSRTDINKTIEVDTKNHIKNLLPEGSIDDNTRMVLTNAIYFKGNWDVSFDPKQTRDNDFTLSSGEKIKCPTMYAKDQFKTFEGKTYKALQMNYKDKKLSMLVLLPNEDVKMAEFESSLSYNLFKTTVDGLAGDNDIKVYLPKFKIESATIQLKEALSKMGMPLAFSNQADFSGMTKKNDLKIGNVYHKAFIEVSEEGTTAAAATAVSMVMKTAFVPQNLFVVNRPFVYILMDNTSQTILFMGKVERP